MRSCVFSVPQHIEFAPGAIKKLPETVVLLETERVIIATGPRVAKTPQVTQAIELLRSAGTSVQIFTDIEANPSVETVGRLAEAYKASDAQAIIAIGGGSPMDAAKAAAAVAAYGGTAADYEGGGRVPGPAVPLIAIPTTAGTGSEATSFSVITHRARGVKMTISSPYLLPVYILLDPELLSTMPARVAAATGADALVHAVEAYISLAASPFSDAMAEKALELIGGNIGPFTANRGDVESASGMLLGSALAGTAFNHAKLGDVHAMSHPVSAHFGAAHGEANAVLLPTVLEYNQLADKGKYARILRLLGAPEGMGLPEYIRSLFKSLGLPRSLKDLGVDPSLIPQLARDAMKSGNIPVNPRSTTEEDFVSLYERAF